MRPVTAPSPSVSGDERKGVEDVLTCLRTVDGELSSCRMVAAFGNPTPGICRIPAPAGELRDYVATPLSVAAEILHVAADVADRHDALAVDLCGRVACVGRAY